MSTEAIEALHQRIKDLAVNSTPDQLAYLAKALELIRDKKAISEIEQMTEIKEIIDAIQKRLKDLAANSTSDQLAYLAKALESIIDKSSVSEFVQMTDEKLEELLSRTRSHLSEINSNKENSISAITEARTESISEINTLKANSLAALKESSDSHILLLDTKKDANIAIINSAGEGHKDGLKNLIDNFRAANKAPDVSSIEIISDPEILSRTIKENDLETWLDNSDNQEKFKRMLSNASAVLNITGQSEDNILGVSPELEKLIYSSKAMKLLLESNFALEIMANVLVTNILRDSLGAIDVADVALSVLSNERVVSVITASTVATKRIITSLSVMKVIARHDFIASSVIKSKIAIDAIISNNVVLNRAIKSEVICKEIEANIQNRRQTIVDNLEYSSWLFRKQSGVTVGNGNTTQESGAGSATIYIPTACYNDNDTDFSVNSLLTGNRLAYIDGHSGTMSVDSGIALRGVQVRGTGGSSGNVTFDIYTAL